MAPARSYTSLPKRTRLTYSQRVELCDYALENPTLRLGDLVDWATRQFRLPKPLSEATVRRIRQNADEWRKTIAAGGQNADKRRRSDARAPEVETELIEWIAARGIKTLTGRQIQAEAEAIADRLGLEGPQRPTFSNGWLGGFKARHDLGKARDRKSLSDPIPARIVLTYKQREEICEHATANPTLSHAKLAEWATEKFQLRKYISTGAVRKILLRADEWKGSMTSKEAKNRKRMRLPAAPEVDTLLAYWVSKKRANDTHVSGKEIIDKAQELADELELAEDERPKFSQGWLHRFLQRHNLNTGRKRRSESAADTNDKRGGKRKQNRVDHLLN